MVAQPNSDLVLPTIEQFDQTGQPIATKHNIRLLYYSGMKPTTYAWNHINYILSWPYLPLTDTYTEYLSGGSTALPVNDESLGKILQCIPSK